MITENLTTLKIHKLTKKQYERELEAGRIDTNAIYLTPDEEANSGAELAEKVENLSNMILTDVSLQELYDNGKLYIKDRNDNIVDVIINNNEILTSSIEGPTLYIDYTGYVKFKVSYGANGGDTVKIDGSYVPMLNDEETVYEGYVNNQIEIYGTISYWSFEYFKKDKFEELNKTIQTLLARIEALEAQVSEANTILESI